MVLSGTPEGPNWGYERLYRRWVREGNTPELYLGTWGWFSGLDNFHSLQPLKSPAILAELHDNSFSYHGVQ